MRLYALFFAVLMVWGLKDVRAQETLEITQSDKELVAQKLEEEAESGKHDEASRAYILKVASEFKTSNSTNEIELKSVQSDCADCSQPKKKQSFFSKVGRKLGKGAAWITTTTAKPFIRAAGFVKGAVEKGDKNQDLLALYKFFLAHQSEFDDLYLQAGTPKEMLELMLAQMEIIVDRKSDQIMKDFLAHIGVKKDISDLSSFELSADEIAALDQSKINADYINSHPEYQELRELMGPVTNEEVQDIVTAGYFSKAITFEKYEKAVPTGVELGATIISQIFVPNIALGVVSSTLASLYTAPVVISQLGALASAAVCIDERTQSKFKSDDDLRSFCSYVTNRSLYEISKSRAKGYVAGKKFHQKVAKKVAERKARRAANKAEKERLVPELQ